MVVFIDVAALRSAVNGVPIQSAPVAVTQAMIDEFARTTLDSNWIHLDSERAGRESPYGVAVAHGFLSLSLLVPLLQSCISLPAAQIWLNYGFERVRFVAPVPAGSELRGEFTLTGVSPQARGTRLTWNVELRVHGSPKPVLAATWLLLLLE